MRIDSGTAWAHRRIKVILVIACMLSVYGAVADIPFQEVARLAVSAASVLGIGELIRYQRIKARRERRAEVPGRLRSGATLYLRPFGLDKGPEEVEFQRRAWVGLSEPNWERFSTFDDYICEVLRMHNCDDITAVVPGKEPDYTPSGPDRLLFAQDGQDWKQMISTLMTQARLVVLAIGSSDGVLWELTTALAIVPRHRLLLLLPNGPRGDSWHMLCAQLAKEGPLPLVEHHHPPVALRFFQGRPVTEFNLIKACEVVAQSSIAQVDEGAARLGFPG
jgi:hypothetical protein